MARRPQYPLKSPEVSPGAVKRVPLTSELVHGFSGSLLSQNYDEPAPTPSCHLEWWELCCSDYKRVAIAAPRGHAKSTAITKAYSLAAVLFRAHDYVIVVSDTYQQAVAFLGEIKRDLTTNEDLRQLFDLKEAEVDREDEIVVPMGDGYRFKIKAMGSEQKVRGMLWDNKRPNLIIGDDLENDEIVMNPDRREKFRNWILNALLPTMSERGKVRIVGTILHLDSLLERLMPETLWRMTPGNTGKKDTNTIHQSLKSFTTQPIGGWMSVRYRAHDEKFANVLWPVKWTKERLQEIQQLFVAQGNPEGYYQEYLNRPIDPENAFFKKEDFQEFTDGDYTRSWDYTPTYLSCDLAVSTKERRDWCAFGIASVDDNGTLYIRHVIRDRMDPKEQVETIVRLQERYKFTTMLIGKGALEKSIGPFLLDALRRKGKFLHIEAIAESTDKRLRAQAIRGRMRAGGVKFNKKAFWYQDLEEEMKVFDRGTYDDQVDMMALVGMYLDNLLDAPTPKEAENIAWEDENADAIEESFFAGRSPMTGY